MNTSFTWRDLYWPGNTALTISLYPPFRSHQWYDDKSLKRWCTEKKPGFGTRGKECELLLYVRLQRDLEFSEKMKLWTFGGHLLRIDHDFPVLLIPLIFYTQS